MKSAWNTDDAEALVRHYEKLGHQRDLALRLYSCRLLGADPRLVQHGGGNTSLKTTGADISGAKINVIRVKGSGWDLANIEPEGMPAMRLDALLALKAVSAMSDEAMVNAQRTALLDSTSPNPSVETLLHAWAPFPVIDHTHANAVLSLVDQADGEHRARDLYKDELAICPYVMPGFGLAHQVRNAIEAAPSAVGAILLKHGIFSWGEDARESYERMISLVSRAEAAIERSRTRAHYTKTAPAVSSAGAAPFLPELRGALAEPLDEGAWRRVVLEARATADILRFLERPDLDVISQQGPVTPDHVLRIKPWPLVLPKLHDQPSGQLRSAIRNAVEAYRARYAEYFTRNNTRFQGEKRRLDATPRVILAPGVGLFAAGASATDAGVIADIAETNIAVMMDAEALGRFESIPEADVFDVEYWSLEQAKLGKAKPSRLMGQIVLVTGGASGIGAAVVKAFAAEGAAVAILDRDLAGAQRMASAAKGIAIGCDVTRDESVEEAFGVVQATWGGVDIVVSNAGAAWTGRIGEVSDAALRESFELNFFGHQRVAKCAVAIMQRQETGGALLFNVSKQAINPGPDFGPYGIPKAALLALARQYAVDYGAKGIRANAVNADRIRSGLLTDEMVTERAKARGVSELEYLGGNLLGREVRASDVAQAFVALALAERTTGAVLTVDGGNIAAALR